MSNNIKGKGFFALLAIICYLLSVLACDNLIDKPKIQKPVKNGYGKVSISFTGETALQETAGRTVLPPTVFDKYVYTFTKAGETTGVPKTPDSDGFFTLEVGSYTVAVQAYVGTAELYTLTASGVSSPFTVGSGSNSVIKVFLSELTAEGQGKFSYTITYPAGAEAEITLQQWPALNTITLTPVNLTEGNGKTQTLELGAGSYLLTVLVSKNELYAGISEAVHIYPSLPTVYTKNFADGDLLEAPIFTSIAALNTYLQGKPANTAATPYIVALNVSDLGGRYNTAGSAGYVLSANNTKYVSLDLSGSTITSIGNNAFFNCTSLTGITIPDSVTSIEYWAFRNCDSLTSVIIPNSVTSIGNGAFERCTSLTSVTIPDSVTSIGSEAFSNCTSLTGITIPDSVTSIGIGAFEETAWFNNQPDGVVYAGKVAYKYKGTMPANTVLLDGTKGITDYAFSGCTGLTGALTIPNSVISIGNGAFSNCGLTSVTFTATSKVTSIGEFAFSSCTRLTSVTIPNSVTSIGDYAFYNCASLTSVTLPTNAGFTSIGYYAFYNCASLTSVTIPNSVTSIEESAFFECANLTSVTFTATSKVTSIGSEAFCRCYKLTSVTIPNSVTSIGSSAFYGCESLNSVTLPTNASFTSIGEFAFSGCRFTSVTIPNSVTSIGESAFERCTSLTSITFTATSKVTSIGESAFLNCISLTSITIPNSVKSIGDYAFYGCRSLNSVTIGNSVTSIEQDAFCGCTSLTAITVDAANTAYSSDGGVLYNKNKTILIQYPAGKTDSVFTIPDGVTSIGNHAFYNCTSLTSITIPNSVTSIGYQAFFFCTSLTSITIPNSVTSIGNGAFSNCTSLTSVTFQRANTTIADDSSFPYGSTLRTAYSAGGIGTYTRASGTWTKQP